MEVKVFITSYSWDGGGGQFHWAKKYWIFTKKTLTTHVLALFAMDTIITESFCFCLCLWPCMHVLVSVNTRLRRITYLHSLGAYDRPTENKSVCTVQLVQKQAQFAQKTGAIWTKSNVICTERSPLISKMRCHSTMCHIVQLHTVTQLRWGNRLGSKRGFWERNKVAVWHNIIKDIAVCLTMNVWCRV